MTFKLSGKIKQSSTSIKEGFISILGKNSSSTYKATGISLDSSYNIYTVGYIDPGYTPPYNTILLVKYKPSGIIEWQRTLDAAYWDEGYSIDIDNSNNIYIVGTTKDSYYNAGILIAKYNTSGVLQWQRTLKSSFTTANRGDISYSVGIGSTGSVYLTGKSYNGTYDDIIVANYDTSGNLQWQRTLDSTNSDIAYSIAIGTLDNIYICGQTFDSGEGGDSKVIVVKYNSSGTLQWQRTFTRGAGHQHVGKSCCLDSSDNVYSISEDGIIVKYNSSGDVQWNKLLSITNLSFNSINIDSSNYLYAVGLYNTGTYNNSIIVKFDTSGNIQWIRYMKTSSGNSNATGISFDNSSNLFVSATAPSASGENIKFVLYKLPGDGSGIGTYSNFDYGIPSYTYSTVALTTSTSSLTGAASTLTSSTSTLTSAKSELYYTHISIP